MGIFSFLKKKNKSDDEAQAAYSALDKRLDKTRSRFRDSLVNFFRGNKPVDNALLEELENELIMADVGVDATSRIMDSLRNKVARSQLADSDALRQSVREELLAILSPVEQPLEIPDTSSPFVILVVGVNGSGKTTTIGKLTRQLLDGGMSVMLVIFDALQSASAKGVDVLIADTAGRLHTQDGLMEELKKVKRVLAKIDASAPHETLLVLDGGTGQNALSQAQQFNAAMSLDGIAITKLDGTARGGVLFAIAEKLGIPLRFIGVGEGVEDLRVFQATEFVDAIISNELTETSE